MDGRRSRPAPAPAAWPSIRARGHELLRSYPQNALKCAASINKCASGLVKDRIEYHLTAAKSLFANEVLDEEACELGPIPNKPGKAPVERCNACTNAKRFRTDP